MTQTQQLIAADPKDLVIEANVRLNPRLDKEFLDSIREHGVMQPVTAFQDQGQLKVLMGQRRTLAAVEVGRDSIPVYVVDEPDQIRRLSTQMVENDQRAPLTDKDRVAAVNQLALLGVPAAQIAKKISRPRAEVDKALKVAASQRGGDAVERGLTLEQAAVLVEFEDDEDALRELETTKNFDHTAQRLRDEREIRAKVEELTAPLIAAGVQIVEYCYDPQRETLPRLRNAEGEPLTPEGHADCPGHAAMVQWGWRYSDGGKERDYRVDYLCLSWAKHGHRHRDQGAKKRAADMTPEERAAASAQRRDVIESNKAWDSAETVRREWLKQFLTAKTAPKGARAFIAKSLVSRDGAVQRTMERNNALAHELFGHQPTYGSNPLDEMVEAASEARAEVISLGVVLGAYESATSRSSWRQVVGHTARYLLFLAEHGYQLSWVEKRAAGLVEGPDPETAQVGEEPQNDTDEPDEDLWQVPTD